MILSASSNWTKRLPLISWSPMMMMSARLNLPILMMVFGKYVCGSLPKRTMAPLVMRPSLMRPRRRRTVSANPDTFPKVLRKYFQQP